MPGVEQFGRSITIFVHGVQLVRQRPDGDEDTTPTLDCDFTVSRWVKPEPQPLSLTIYNLSQENRERLTQQQERARQIGWRRLQAVQSGAVLVLPGQEAATQQALVAQTGLVEIFAGYQTDASLLCRYQIMPQDGIDHVYNGVDWVTTIRAQDGRLPWQNAWVSESMVPGVLLRDIQRVLVASEEMLEGTLDEDTFAQAYPELLQYKPEPGYRNGYVLHGPTKDMNTDILETLGLEAFYRDGTLQYIRKGAATWPDAVRLSQANNVLAAPESMDRGFYKVKSLLDHRLEPGRQVQVFGVDDVTPIGAGIFRIDEVVHVGSNYGSPFDSTMILRPSNISAASNP
jgi:hypothetical protein